jgi:hypothetical protein
LGEAVKMGLIWAATWFGVGMTILVVALILTGETGADVPYPLGFAMLGFFAGAVFSGMLGTVRRDRRLHEFSLPSVAAWGALSGLLFSGIFIGLVVLAGDGFLDVAAVGIVFSLACAASATVSAGLARWGQARHTPHAQPGGN